MTLCLFDDYSRPLLIPEEEVENVCQMHDVAMLSFVSIEGRSLKTI